MLLRYLLSLVVALLLMASPILVSVLLSKALIISRVNFKGSGASLLQSQSMLLSVLLSQLSFELGP